MRLYCVEATVTKQAFVLTDSPDGVEDLVDWSWIDASPDYTVEEINTRSKWCLGGCPDAKPGELVWHEGEQDITIEQAIQIAGEHAEAQARANDPAQIALFPAGANQSKRLYEEKT